MKPAGGSEGYTVAEFLLSVLIFTGLLAVFFSRYQAYMFLAARSEGLSNLGAIRSTETAYFAEWNFWIGNQPPTPVADRRGNNSKVPWDPNTRFSLLGFAPEGDVRFSYGLEGPDRSPEGFTAFARGDLDLDRQLASHWITHDSSFFSPRITTSEEEYRKALREWEERYGSGRRGPSF